MGSANQLYALAKKCQKVVQIANGGIGESDIPEDGIKLTKAELVVLQQLVAKAKSVASSADK